MIFLIIIFVIKLDIFNWTTNFTDPKLDPDLYIVPYKKIWIELLFEFIVCDFETQQTHQFIHFDIGFWLVVLRLRNLRRMWYDRPQPQYLYD